MNKSFFSQVSHKILGGGSVFIILLTGGLIVTFIGEIFAGTTKHGVADQLGLITFLAGMFFVSSFVVFSQWKEHLAQKEVRIDQAILSGAKNNGGVFSISQAALSGGFAIGETKTAFERLAATGICQVDVTVEGELCYVFPAFTHVVAVNRKE